MLRVTSGAVLSLLLGVGLVVAMLPSPSASASAVAGTDQIVNITFPVHDQGRLTSYHNDYFGQRSRGDHGATDIGGPNAYGLPVHAAVGGRITSINGIEGRSLPSWGWAISILGTDGRTYRYLHLGRQDGPAEEAYAPGLVRGSEVQRGQHIGYVGHSGNASASWPHLHFEISDPNVVDRQGTDRINPYFSLRDAEARRDYPSGSVARVNRARFSDVPSDHPHLAGITWVAEQGITRGCATPGHYCPSNGVTRGQMATFLMLAGKLPDGGPHGFSDVPAGHPHERGIAAIKAAGITSGVGGGRFDPQGIVRRDQMATFLRNALDLPRSDRRFPDVHGSSPHAGAIGSIADAGITTGYKDGTYQPGLTVTRAQMATFLQRAHAAR
ncbi:S-layer homology domain-containing protein [Nitriliruptor alkaliphilus]|uniref:S-layer homology domain-containing protein n=1 Tax=Nitriliruptor alkaliphilus TaxID=427918 RepID=UPI000695F665|nr:S-layer homology domain-containing protein [Nitriliruptor alkaliphilus]